MFTLRTVFTYGQGSEVKETTNKFLGDHYQVYYRDSYYFQNRMKEESDGHFKDVFALLVNPDKHIELLYDTQYYIVTKDGKTFEKLYMYSNPNPHIPTKVSN